MNKIEIASMRDIINTIDFSPPILIELRFPNGMSVFCISYELCFGGKEGLIEANISGPYEDKFFETCFGWLTKEDLVVLLEQVEIVETDDFHISDEFYGKHLPSEDQVRESVEKLEKIIGV